VTAIYSPYSNLNVGVAGVSASGVTGNGQQIVDGTTGISGSNVEFFNSSGISETTPVSMSGTVQSAFSGSGPVYIYIENTYGHTGGTNLYPITGNCAYALVASGNAIPAPPPISASFNTTSQTTTVLPTYTTTAGTEIRTVSSAVTVRGISGTTLGGAGDFGGGGGGYFGGGGGIVGGAGGNGSSFITGITGAAANNGSGTDGYRNRYNNYVYGGAQQSGAIVIETVNSDPIPTLTVNGTISSGAITSNGASIFSAGLTASDVTITTDTLTVNNSPYAFPPVGSIIMYGGATAPSGWLVCDGTPVPPQYTALIAIIGPNRPDLRSRVPLGLGSGPGLSAYNTMGATGGLETVTLTTNEMPSHSHTLSPSPLIWNNPAGVGRGSNTDLLISTNGPTGTDSTGGGQAHENRQPYLVVNFIIKF
jgi:microcystin-dependent protein